MMRDQIEQQFRLLKHKGKFLRIAETEFNKTYNTLKNHWFSGGFSIPEEYQSKALELIKKSIKEELIKK